MGPVSNSRRNNLAADGLSLPSCALGWGVRGPAVKAPPPLPARSQSHRRAPSRQLKALIEDGGGGEPCSATRSSLSAETYRGAARQSRAAAAAAAASSSKLTRTPVSSSGPLPEAHTRALEKEFKLASRKTRSSFFNTPIIHYFFFSSVPVSTH